MNVLEIDPGDLLVYICLTREPKDWSLERLMRIRLFYIEGNIITVLFTFSTIFLQLSKEPWLLFFPSYYYNHAIHLIHIFIPQTCTEVLLISGTSRIEEFYSCATQTVVHKLVLAFEPICY